MNCSISPKTIKALRMKVAKDLLVINEKGQPWSVEEYIREIYDFVLKATEGQEDNVTKALDAARLVPSFMEVLKPLDKRIRNAIKINSDADAVRLENLVDDFTSDEGLVAIENFLNVTEDLDENHKKRLYDDSLHGNIKISTDDTGDFEKKASSEILVHQILIQ